MTPQFKLLVCDLDNTLYDWVSYFVPSFYAMIESALPLISVDLETLLDDMREVHRLHHDSEHPFALLETEAVRRSFPGKTFEETARLLDPAFHQFNRSRLDTLRLYDGVLDGLNLLNSSGVTLVAHTESKLYGALGRLEQLGIRRFFSSVYCLERPRSQQGHSDFSDMRFRRYSTDNVVELSHHQRKPSKDVLLEICERQGVPVTSAAYVGDSIPRDIMMAQQAGVFAIWAKYGASVSKADYEKLVRISHWSAADVEREQALKSLAEGVRPDYIANSFRDVVERVMSVQTKSKPSALGRV